MDISEFPFEKSESMIHCSPNRNDAITYATQALQSSSDETNIEERCQKMATFIRNQFKPDFEKWKCLVGPDSDLPNTPTYKDATQLSQHYIYFSIGEFGFFIYEY